MCFVFLTPRLALSSISAIETDIGNQLLLWKWMIVFSKEENALSENERLVLKGCSRECYQVTSGLYCEQHVLLLVSLEMVIAVLFPAPVINIMRHHMQYVTLCVLFSFTSSPS